MTEKDFPEEGNDEESATGGSGGRMTQIEGNNLCKGLGEAPQCREDSSIGNEGAGPGHRPAVGKCSLK